MGRVGEDAGASETILERLSLQREKPIIGNQLRARRCMVPLRSVLLRPALDDGRLCCRDTGRLDRLAMYGRVARRAVLTTGQNALEGKSMVHLLVVGETIRAVQAGRSAGRHGG